MRIAIVGAGMAGLSCGEALLARGHDVSLFDKGRRPGGRMSTKTLPTALGDVGFDYGSQFMVVRDPSFRARVERWRQAGVVAPWLAAGPDAWVGTPGMSAPLVEVAGHLNVSWSARVASIAPAEAGRWQLVGERADEGCYDAVVVALPAEQVGPIVREHDPSMAALAAAAPSQPCWTVMAAFAEPLPIAADVIAGVGPVEWAGRNSAKSGRHGPEAWVINASTRWSVQHLEEDHEAVATALLAAFGDQCGVDLPHPLVIAAHRWRYARSSGSGLRCVWNPERKLGLCGDWLIASTVEAAWMSGAALAGVV